MMVNKKGERVGETTHYKKIGPLRRIVARDFTGDSRVRLTLACGHVVIRSAGTYKTRSACDTCGALGETESDAPRGERREHDE